MLIYFPENISRNSLSNMDIFWVYIGILSASIFLLYSFSKKKPSSPDKNLPPGNTGWPLIGEMWDFVMATRRGTPEKFITKRMGKYSPEVFKTGLLGEKMAVFCGAAGNKFLFSNENRYVNSWWPSSVALVLGKHDNKGTDTGELTLQVRVGLLEYLRPQALQRYIPIMDSFAKQQMETDWSPYQQVTVLPLSKKYGVDLACKLFMNLTDPSRIERMMSLFERIATGVTAMPLNFPGTSFHRAVGAGKIIRGEIEAIAKERKKEVRENAEKATGIDMLTCMVKEKEVDDKQIAYSIFGLLSASFDTMSVTLTSIVYFLEKYPHIYEMVYKEQKEIADSKSSGELLNWDDVQKMKYSWWVACESMRLSPPAGGTFRQAIVDFKFAGYSIPKGWKIYWTVNSTHRDPNYFPDPDKFDPTRFEGKGPVPFSFVPFGGGPRMCPGKEYARLAILVFMHNLVTKFKFKNLNPNAKFVYQPNPAPEDGLLIKLVSVDK